MVSPVKTAVQDIKRLREIASVLTSHGFQAFARSAGLERFVDADEPELLEFEEPNELLPEEDDTEVATRFRNVLEDLGPTYVKLGQVLSTRPDILPRTYIEELQKLQDQVPPMSFEKVREQIESELGGTLDELFEEVREKPLAAASIGQVHRARTHEGMPCVVKVQRPSIRDKIQSDLAILYYLARFLEATVEELELYTPTAIVEEFEEAILSELDFEHEARSIQTFGENFVDEPNVAVPGVFEELSTDRVLTLEYIDGDKLSEIEGGTPRAHRVLDTLLEAMYQMVLEDGFFHGDPHPGNIMVDSEDTLVFIDFGLVGTLSPRQQRDLSDLILMVLTGDEDGIARTLLQMGYPVGRVNLRELKSDIVEIRDEYLFSTLGEVDVSEFVQETMDAAQRHQIRLNPSYARLTKAAMTIEGLIRRLHPEMDLMDKGMPYARRLAGQRFSAQNVLKGVMNSAMGFSGFIQQVPQHLDQILMDLESGNLTVIVQNESLNKLGTRLFLGMIASALAICATMILSQFDYYLYGVSMLMVAGIILAVNAGLFFWWALGWHLWGGGGGSKVKITPLLRLFQRGSED